MCVISPGTRPTKLTVEKRSPLSNVRNPIAASFVAKGPLPHRGVGAQKLLPRKTTQKIRDVVSECHAETLAKFAGDGLQCQARIRASLELGD